MKMPSIVKHGLTMMRFNVAGNSNNNRIPVPGNIKLAKKRPPFNRHNSYLNAYFSKVFLDESHCLDAKLVSGIGHNMKTHFMAILIFNPAVAIPVGHPNFC